MQAGGTIKNCGVHEEAAMLSGTTIPRACAILACLLTIDSRPVIADDPQTTAHGHWLAGRYAEALDVYGRLAKAEDRPVVTAIGLSRAHQSSGQWKSAAAVLEAARKTHPRDSRLPAHLAEVRFWLGQYRQAERAALAAIKLETDQPLARLVLADVYTETGRIAKADEAYRWFIRYYNRRQPKDAETLLLVARGSVRYARWNRVSQIFDFVVNTLCPDVLKAHPRDWRAHWVSGSLLLEKYNRAEAIPDLERALAINPRATPVLISLGTAAFQKRNLEQAADYAERALRVDSHCIGALQLKADVALAAGRVSVARRLIEQALRVNPRAQRSLARLAACDLFIDGFPSADRWKKLLSHLDSIGTVQFENPGRFTRGLIELAKRNPRPGYFLTRLASLLEMRRQFDAAEQLYRQAIRSMPQLAEPKTALAMLYMSIGKTEAAGRLLDEAFQADPYHVRVSNMRKVLKLLNSYRTITTAHFIVRFDGKTDAVLGPAAAEYLEEIYPELTRRFGFEPPHKTQVEIYHDARGLSAHQWFSARMIGLPFLQTVGASTGYIIAMASPTAGDKPFNWARVLKHEFVHIITLQQTRFHIPHWFTEALAVSAEGYPRPPRWNTLLRDRVPKGDLRNLDDLNDGFIRPRSAADWQFAYCQSRLYVEFMTRTFGRKSVSKLLAAYRDNVPTAIAIPQTFSITKAEFERRYRADLDRIVGDLDQESFPLGVATMKNRVGLYEQTGRTDKLKPLLLRLSQLDPDDPVVRRKLARMALAEEAYSEAARYAVMTLHIDVLDADAIRILKTARKKGAGVLSPPRPPNKTIPAPVFP